MRKGIGTKKLNRTSNERKQLFRNLIRSLALHGYLVTSEAKAKAVKPIFEKLVTLAKKNTVLEMRRLVSETGNVDVSRSLLKLGSLFAKRPGGYTRIIRLGVSAGDNTQKVRLELVERLVEAEEVVAPPKTVAPEVKTGENEKTETKKVTKRTVTKKTK